MGQFEGDTRILRVNHRPEACATLETDPLPEFAMWRRHPPRRVCATPKGF